MLTHSVDSKQPLSICQVTAGFLGFKWCVVNSEFTNLHLMDFPLSLFLPPTAVGRGQPLAEWLVLCELSVLVIAGITITHSYYGHSTNALQLLSVLLGRLFRSAWAYDMSGLLTEGRIGH